MKWQRLRNLHLPQVHALGRSDGAIVAAVLLLALALGLPPVTLQRPTYSYLVTFDLTQSMDVEDMSWNGRPASRLAAARAAMRELLPRLPCGSRIGWAVFADYRTLPLMLPVEVCSHYDELLASLDRIDGRMRWANASNVAKGATWTVRTARLVDDATRVLFFTDGHESPPLRERESPPMGDITPGEVGGWLVGVGGETPQRIPKTTRDGQQAGYWAAQDVVQRTDVPAAQSHEHLSELREEHLVAVAKLIGLGYRRLTTAEALADAVLEPSLARDRPTPTDVRWVAVGLALGLLVWRFLPGWGWRRQGAVSAKRR